MTGLGANLLARSALASPDKALSLSPESLLLIGEANGAAAAVRAVRAKGFRGPIYGFSNTGESLLAELLGPAGAGVVVARVVPKSDNAKVAVVRELAADASLAKLGKPNVYMLEGYIAARAFVEALRRVTELNGPQTLSYRDMLAALRQAQGKGSALWLPMPWWLMKLVAWPARWLPQNVFSLDTVRMLQAGSVSGRSETERWLGRTVSPSP